MSLKGRLHLSIQLVDGVWMGIGQIVAIDPTKNPNVLLGIWGSFSAKIAERYPALFEKWKDLMKETCQHVAGEINKQPPEQTKLYNLKDTKDAN